MPALPTPNVTEDWGDDLNAAIESLHLQGTHASRPSSDLVTGTLYSCSDHGLVYLWDGDSWGTWATLGGGSSAGVALVDYGGSVAEGTAVGTVVFEKGSEVVVHDFTGGSLPSGWTARGTVSPTFGGSGMTVSYSAGSGHQYSLSSPGTAYSVEAKLVAGSSSAMHGPMISDSSGNGATACWYGGSGGLIVAKQTGWTYASATQVVATTPYFPVWLRIRVDGSNYYAAHSADGISWTETAALSHVVASPSTMSVGSIINTQSLTVEQVRFRPAGGEGGLRGWWDGSSVVPF